MSFVLSAFAAPTGLSPSGGETVALLDDVQGNYLYKMSVDERGKVMSGSTTLKGLTKETFCVGSPVTLSWKGASGTCSVEVRKIADVRTVVASTTALGGAVAEAATVREGTVVWTGTTSGTSVSVVNLELDADYEWTVTDSSGASAPAKFRTASEPPRLIKAGSMKMMRDLGGWTGLDGHKIRQNRIFRGGPPNDAKNSPEQRLDDDAAHAFLVGQVGLKTQVDFRDGGTSENGKNPQFDEAVTYKNNYFYWYKLYGIDSGYSTTSAEGKSFVDTLKTILDPAQRPVYFHCTMGRDRTGTIAALTLALLGVSREDILRDFQTTTYLDRSNGTSSMTKILDEKLGKYKTGLTLAENTAAYFTEKLGITAEQIETFRKDMLIGYGEPPKPTDLSPATTEANPISLLSSAQHTYLYEKTYVERDKVSSSSVSFTGGSPVTLAWKGTSGICTVSVKRLSDGKAIWTGTTSGTSVSVVNLEIGAGYAWTVTDASKNTASATFYTSAEPPRLIKTGDMVAMRDLGGWTGRLGGKEYTVRQNQLFRGGPAKNVDEAAKAFFRDIVGLRTELDFRGTSSDRLDVTGVTYVPLSRDSSYRVKKADMDKKDRDYWPNLIETFRVIFDAGQRPAYFHCSLGKDRTGVTACLALGLLGVSEEDIWRDWQATAVGADIIGDGTYMAGYIRDMKDYKGQSNLNEAIERYFTEDLGFTADEIETFRKDMLVGYEPPKPTYWTEEPHFVTATRMRLKAGKVTEEQYEGFETKRGFWYTWGKDGVELTGWTQADGTPLKLAKPAGAGWKLLVKEGEGK